VTALSTHVLDAAGGHPAAGVLVTLQAQDGRSASARTDADGRASGLGGPDGIGPGTHRLILDTGDFLASRGYVASDGEAFFPLVTVTFTVTDQARLHIPILLSPYSYTVYRGS
jgi:5-hydroxyisourate hydrolase